MHTFPFPFKKKYAKFNRLFFEFAYSTTHSAEKKGTILKDQKHITILSLHNENTPISNYSNSNFENDELDSNIFRNMNKNNISNTSTPFYRNNLHTQIDTSLVKLTNHVRENIMAAKSDFDNFIRKNKTESPEICDKNISQIPKVTPEHNKHDEGI